MRIASLTEIWDIAAERLTWLRGLYGTPAAFLNVEAEFTAEARRAILSLLRPIEHLVRCALALMALALPQAAPPAQRSRGSRAACAPRWPGAESAAWTGVRFTLTTGAKRGRRRRHERAAPAAVYYRFALAKRMEAIARVLAQPERWARRMAQIIRKRRKAPVRRGPLLRFPAMRGDEHCDAAAAAVRCAIADTS